jgi:hypothetical protein
MRRAIALVAAALLAACGRSPTSSRSPAPAAEFLVSAGDSTFWVGSGPKGVRVRGSPILLARYDGRFYEIYLSDDDRSYADALFIGERLYRRDIVSGDSALVFSDSMVPRLAAAYARSHPDDRRLSPGEETSEDPANSATAELEVVELFGPYASFEYHADVDLEGGRPWHTTRRGVIDLRSGRQTSVVDLIGKAAAQRVAELGRKEFEAARDSVRRIRDTLDTRNARAREAFSHLRFDETSFTLTATDGRPAIRFAVTGRGEGPGGNSVELDATPVDPGPWWAEVRLSVPDSGAEEVDRWTRKGYSVFARYLDTTSLARIYLTDGRHEWIVATVSAPIHRIDWLDAPPIDSTERRALGRAFDEAAAYDERVKVARSNSVQAFRLAGDSRRMRPPFLHSKRHPHR